MDADHIPQGSLEPGQTDKARILYATDPICSHCWAMEPAWRRFHYLYGTHLSVTHLYGGLLPGWEGFSDSAGIQQPSDLPPHWEEVVQRYGQPMDPSVWYTDPLASSSPPSVAVHAVRLIAPAREEDYLRRIRQALFLEARNIARPEVLIACAADIGLDMAAFETAFRAPAAEQAFEKDLATKGDTEIRGFPTLIVTAFSNEEPWVMKGPQPFFRLERALGRVLGDLPPARDVSVNAVLQEYGSGTTREFSEILQLDAESTEAALREVGAIGRPLANSQLWSAE